MANWGAGFGAVELRSHPNKLLRRATKKTDVVERFNMAVQGLQVTDGGISGDALG